MQAERAASLNGNDGAHAVVERSRDLRGKARIEGHRELATKIVDAVTDMAFPMEDDDLDLEDVRAHGTTMADRAARTH